MNKNFVLEEGGGTRRSFIINLTFRFEEGSEGVVGELGRRVGTGTLLGTLGRDGSRNETFGRGRSGTGLVVVVERHFLIFQNFEKFGLV